jgi:hypothetical protein
MKCWVAVICVASLAGCYAAPQISVTDASPRRVGLLVQNAWLVPMQKVDEQAASLCRQHGLSYRRIDAVWINRTLKQVVYDCAGMERLLARKPQVRRLVIAKSISNDPKTAAWTKARVATDAWALCLRFAAERKAKETTQAPGLVAQEVVDACSKLEHAVYEPLEAAGEISSQFQGELHAQAVQYASDAVMSVRIKAEPIGQTDNHLAANIRTWNH